MMQTNVLAVMALTKAVLKGMIARDRGHVINISSIAAHEAYSGGRPLALSAARVVGSIWQRLGRE